MCVCVCVCVSVSVSVCLCVEDIEDMYRTNTYPDGIHTYVPVCTYINICVLL